MGKCTALRNIPEFIAIVAECRSIACVLRRLRLRGAGGNYDTIKRAASQLKLDTSHWTGQGHRKGSKIPIIPLRDLKLVLVKNSFYQSSKLRRRLIREGLLAARCSICEISTWLGKPVSLELDHRDGDRHNNELVNLRLLCPNCHAQTPTYRGRNIKIGRKERASPGGGIGDTQSS